MVLFFIFRSRAVKAHQKKCNLVMQFFSLLILILCFKRYEKQLYSPFCKTHKILHVFDLDFYVSIIGFVRY